VGSLELLALDSDLARLGKGEQRLALDGAAVIDQRRCPGPC
jgi:hypothetical protein